MSEQPEEFVITCNQILEHARAIRAVTSANVEPIVVLVNKLNTMYQIEKQKNTSEKPAEQPKE